SPDGRWFRKRRAAWGQPGRAGARSTPFASALRRREFPLAPAYRLGARWPQVLSLPCSSHPRLLNGAGLCIPDLAGVLGDRAIAREFSGAGDVQDGLASPSFRVAVKLTKSIACFNVRFQVSQVHVVVALGEQHFPNRLEDARLVPAKVVGEDEIERGPRFRVVLVVPVRAVPASAPFDLLGGESKEEEILLSGLFSHFDRRAVSSSECERSVHHEFHVARPARLVSRGRD